jgi:hypothetical protein
MSKRFKFIFTTYRLANTHPFTVAHPPHPPLAPSPSGEERFAAHSFDVRFFLSQILMLNIFVLIC